MSILDYTAFSLINGLAGRSITFDKIMVAIVDQPLLKGGLMMALIWWLWFKETDDTKSRFARESILATIAACFFSLFSARILVNSLPFRIRPICDPSVPIIMPSGWHRQVLESWSSFPSDHAVMFFTLAVGIFFISRIIGALVLVYVTVIICFPRIFLGLHYPSDVLAGALLGTFFAVVFNQQVLRHYIAKPFNYWMLKSAGLFYGVCFLLTFEMAVLFDDIRFLAEKAFNSLGLIAYSAPF